MIGILQKTIAFVRWVAASEQLPAWPQARGGKATKRRVLPWLFAADGLCSTPPESPQAPDGRGFWRWLLGKDELPRSLTACERHGSWPHGLTWILSTEECPHTKAAPGRRGGGSLRALLSPEKCPQIRFPTPGRRVGLVGWLLLSEPCPQLEEPERKRRVGFLRWLMAPDRL